MDPTDFEKREQAILRSLMEASRSRGVTDVGTGAHHDFEQNFPELYHSLTTAREAQWGPWLQMLEHYRDYYLAPKPAGLLLLGAPGVGKSTLAALVAKVASHVCNQRPAYIDCPRMREHLRGLPSERRRSHGDYMDAMDPGDWPILVIDDVGEEAGNVEAQNLVTYGLHERRLAHCYTIVTSNKTWVNLMEHLGGDRQISRVAHLKVIEFGTELPDYRVEDSRAGGNS